MTKNHEEHGLVPGERPYLGSQVTVSGGPSEFHSLWVRVKERTLLSVVGVLTRDGAIRFLTAYKNILRRTIHLQGQDEETRLWAADKFCDAERDVLAMAGLAPWTGMGKPT